MAYDEKTAARARHLLKGESNIAERKMFGGLAFMVKGHMCCGVLKDYLMLRLGEDGARAALVQPHTALMDFTGKPMKSTIYVRAEGHRTDVQLRRWLQQVVALARTLPEK